jgi:hypothetical protein
MNERQEAFFAQARSDYEIFLFLDGQAACHRLHYLQMCTEKLGKAYFLQMATPPNLGSHAALVKFLQTIVKDAAVRASLGFRRRTQWERKVKAALDVAYKLQQLAPALAGDGPNPEYPWPRDQPNHAPVNYDFPLWKELRNTARGREFLKLLRDLLNKFPDWWP